MEKDEKNKKEISDLPPLYITVPDPPPSPEEDKEKEEEDSETIKPSRGLSGFLVKTGFAGNTRQANMIMLLIIFLSASYIFSAIQFEKRHKTTVDISNIRYDDPALYENL